MNESIHKAYLDMSAIDVITFNTLEFSRYFIKSLRNVGISIDKDQAKSIQNKMFNDFNNSNNILYNGAELVIKDPKFKQNDIEITLKLAGSNFFLKIRNIVYYDFSFRVSKMTLRDLLSKIEEKLEFFKDGVDYKKLRELGTVLSNDSDSIESKKDKFSDLENYFKSIKKIYSGYDMNYDVQQRGPKEKTLSVSISYDFFRLISEDYTDEVHDAKKLIGSINEMQYYFQIKEMNKICKLIVEFIERKYGFSAYRSNFGSSIEMYFIKSTQKSDMAGIRKTISEIKEKDRSGLITRRDLHLYVIHKLFES
jgi:hypothetical protein